MARWRPGRILLVIPLLLAGFGCEAGVEEGPEGSSRSGNSGATPTDQTTFTDQAGKDVTLPVGPARVVSLVPAATETLVELGAGDALVGRTDFDERSEVAHLPSVGGGLNPSLERLIALEPELVIRFEGEQDRATPQALDRAGIPHMGVRPDRIQDIHTMVRLLGQVMDRDEEAHDLIRKTEEELEAVRARVDGVERPRVLFLLGGDPPWVVGPETFLHELLVVAGAQNAMDDLESPLYAPVSVEEVARREVDRILIVEGATIPSALREFPVQEVRREVQAPGIGIGSSARHLSELLHPELWP